MTLTWISLLIGIISLIASLLALWQQNRDKPRLKITEIRPALSGTKSSDQQWNHKVSSLEIVVENKGSRAAVECKAAATFPASEAIPLYPRGQDHTINTSVLSFTLQPDSKITLVGAWQYVGGVIDGRGEYPNIGEFVQKFIPVTVTIKYGNKKLSSVLGYAKAKRYFEDHQMDKILS